MGVLSLILTGVVLHFMGRGISASRAAPIRPFIPTVPDFLRQGSYILTGVNLPAYFYKKERGNGFGSLRGINLEAVLNAELRIVAVFFHSGDHVIKGVYLEEGESRIELDPLNLTEGCYGYLKSTDSHLYREFAWVEKPGAMYIGTIQHYRVAHSAFHYSANYHLPPLHVTLREFVEGTHLIANVRIPEYFVIAKRRNGPYKLINDLRCDAVVDKRTKKIVGVFLSQSKHMLFGIYMVLDKSRRIVLPSLQMEEEHFDFLDDEGYELYPEYIEYKRTPEMYRATLEECG